MLPHLKEQLMPKRECRFPTREESILTIGAREELDSCLEVPGVQRRFGSMVGGD